MTMDGSNQPAIDRMPETTTQDMVHGDVFTNFKFTTIDHGTMPTTTQYPKFSKEPPVGSDFFHGSPATSFEQDSVFDNPKKALARDKFVEILLVDPKRAKRILANRQSAARFKERKVRYTSDLEKKMQTLQTEVTSLSAQVNKYERDVSSLLAENKELKIKLEVMEQHVHLSDALTESLREEVKYRRQLKYQNVMYHNMLLLSEHRQPHDFVNSDSQHQKP